MRRRPPSYRNGSRNFGKWVFSIARLFFLGQFHVAVERALAAHVSNSDDDRDDDLSIVIAGILAVAFAREFYVARLSRVCCTVPLARFGSSTVQSTSAGEGGWARAG